MEDAHLNAGVLHVDALDGTEFVGSVALSAEIRIQ